MQRKVVGVLVVVILGLAGCAPASPVVTPVSRGTNTPAPTVEMPPLELAAGLEGFYLLGCAELEHCTPASLPERRLSESSSVYPGGLPHSEALVPYVLIRQAKLTADHLRLWRMTGSIGIVFEPDREARGFRVQGFRAGGFGAERAGVQVGDLITGIEGHSVRDWVFRDDYWERVGTYLLGELNTEVTLQLVRGTEVTETLELRALRNFPTLVTSSEPLPFVATQIAPDTLAVAPETELSAGLYCYEANSSKNALGPLHCFTQGDLALAEPTPLATAAAVPWPPATTGAYRLAATPCRFPTASGVQVDCADLTVPVDWQHPEGAQLRLHVGVFRAANGSSREPAIYLHGGPGGGALEGMTAAYLNGYNRLFADRDWVVFDQRGVGYSVPRLDCPEAAATFVERLSLDESESLLAAEARAVPACQAEWEAAGLDLAQFNSTASAQDLRALIQALGGKPVYLYGTSYGTYLALTYLRQYGAEGQVRALLLEGVLPPTADLFAARGTNAWEALRAVWATCAVQPQCGAAYPDLEAQALALLDALDAHPLTVAVNDPATGQEVTVMVNAARFVEVLYRVAYRTDLLGEIPRLIATTAAGDTSALEKQLGVALEAARAVDGGAYYGALCADVAPFTTLEAAQTANAALPAIPRRVFDDTAAAMLQVCAEWPVTPPAADQAAPVVSDLPVLLLAGRYDPITPPAWAQEAAATLSHGYVAEYPTGHGSLGGSLCAQTVTGAFLANLSAPQPCMDEAPDLRFTLP